MDDRAFDALSRAFAAAGSRRGLLVALAALTPFPVLAERKRKGKGNDKDQGTSDGTGEDKGDGAAAEL